MAAPEPPPQASAAPSYTPIVTDAVRLVRVLFGPRRVFEEQQDKPTFWLPWAVCCAAFIILQFLQGPFQTRVRELALEHAGRPVPAGGPGAVGVVIGIVLGAVTVLVILAVSAGILYLLLSVLGSSTTFKKMLTVAVFAFPIAIIQQILTYLVLSMRGVSSVNGVWDVFVSFGADLLLPADSVTGFTRLVLAGIGPLALWQLWISATGVGVYGKVGKGKAWGIAVAAWLIGLVLAAGMGAMGMKAAGG